MIKMMTLIMTVLWLVTLEATITRRVRPKKPIRPIVLTRNETGADNGKKNYSETINDECFERGEAQGTESNDLDVCGYERYPTDDISYRCVMAV
jgi:hypothetical protein